ncbi:MAG: hypothetical protein ACXW0L_07595 [Methylosarcina sp.]
MKLTNDAGQEKNPIIFHKQILTYQPNVIIVALFFFFAALFLLVSAKLIGWLALPIAASAVFKLGSILLLSAFLLIFVAGLLLMAKVIIRSCYRYFSSDQRVQRRVLYIQGKQNRINRLLYFRKQQIRYFHEQHIKRLRQADERKHIYSLSKAIRKDLLARKKNLPSSVFKELQREHARYRINRDGDALIKLQRKIADKV